MMKTISSSIPVEIALRHMEESRDVTPYIHEAQTDILDKLLAGKFVGQIGAYQVFDCLLDAATKIDGQPMNATYMELCSILKLLVTGEESQARDRAEKMVERFVIDSMAQAVEDRAAMIAWEEK